MTPERWQQVSRIYHDVLARDSSERASFLREACEDDEALRQEVESLLAQPASTENFLGEPALAIAPRLMDVPAEPSLTGQRLGVYHILDLLGVGGMGEVYRARDTRLGRDVAVKVLPRLFSADRERLSRFEREARLLASLNHPHIAAIYGFEETTGVHALVLELVEGPTLADRLQRGPLPIAEAVRTARQIADALEAAHERGVVHRDLKPQNIKVKPDGTVKVLDFGLAKATLAAADDGAGSPASTAPVDGTREGVILGTTTYMSPEQSRGRAVDKRTDIWAFGCVFYEMLTGRAAFAGETISDTMAAVLKQEPDWQALPADTPPGVRSLLRRCLKKDFVDRLHDIADARIEIQEVIAEPAAMTPIGSPRRAAARWTRTIPWVVAAGAVAMALLVVLQATRRTGSAAGPVTRLDLDLPAGVELVSVYPPAMVLSPDGTRVAFVGVFRGLRQLYTRRLDQFETVPIRGTENANAVFMSPDGRALGFITADLALKRVSLADGLVTTIEHDAEFSAGAAWGADDRITFVRAGALWQVPASGGPAKQLTTLDSGKRELLHAWPSVIAEGRILLFASITGSSRGASHIEALSLASGQRRVIVESGTFPLYAPSGHLVFFRDGALLGAPFDVDRLEVTGPVVRVLENLAVGTTMDAPLAALSDAGSLTYAPSDTGTTRLVWVSRQGLEQPITVTPRRYQYPRLAPDGRRTVVAANGDLWIQDIARATLTPLTSEQTVGNAFPVWTPDGTRVLFRTLTGMYLTAADGSGHPEAIAGSLSGDLPCSVSRDGDTLAFMRQNAQTSRDIYVLSLHGQPRPRPVVSSFAYEGGAQFSPDGHWMAYASDESGQMQVYVRPFPGPDRRWPVSTQGGTQPMWNSNGKEIFYRIGNKMMVVDVSGNVDLTLSQPRQLFDQRYVFQNISLANYDVSPDGQQFVMIKDEAGSGRLNVVLNWTEELKRLIPTR
jgi:serine/threonine protein kinase/Tol biopolymer transport system component